MRLAQFIEGNLEPILREWEAFAKTLYAPSAGMTPKALRDHAAQILQAVVKDLGTSQNKGEQAEKSKGRAPESTGGETAAETHAVLRAQSGIDINQLAAEYRALRASVLRLWDEAAPYGPEARQDVMRFNEAIDQALAESIRFFSDRVEQARNLLMGMLGHDMRNPLNAIVMTAAGLEKLNAGEEVSEAAAILTRCGASMGTLLNDLMDLNRTNLGIGISIEVGEADLAALFADEVKQLRAAHPRRQVDVRVEGDLTGSWDGGRLQQVLRNLVSNALAYGRPGDPVGVEVRPEGNGVLIEVRNRGDAIDSSTAAQLFDPLLRGEAAARRSNQEGLGLGLFIVREITRAHGGEVGVRSNEAETVFFVRLPRRPA
jgi:signal transduction histidine kinase